MMGPSGKVINLLNEGSGLDTAATLARWHEYFPSPGNATIMLEELAIAAQTGHAPIEERRLARVVLILEPVPVGQVTLVATVAA